MVSASALLPGDPLRLGDFWLAGRLGAGGQGVVYEAYDSQGARVAIKVLHGNAAGDRGLRARFGKEAAAAQRVASFCTARVLAVDLDAPKPYLVSEYVEGPSLRQAVDGGRRFSGDELHRLATAVATALTAIHDAGVIHRDLKPDNVLLGPDGPRVIDFGVARTPEMSLTATGQVTGTPTYMAPEVFTGQRADTPADVFAWGAIMVYAATGDDPFRAESLGAVMHRVLSAEPDLTVLPRSVRPLVSAALAKDPLARPAASELLLGLVSGGQSSGGQGSRADLLTVGSVEAGLLDRGAPADPTLGTLADDAYEFLEPAERDLVPDLFLRLVNVTDTGEVTVRAASREELSEARTPREQAALARILEVFAYLVTTRGDDITLARPALVRAWPRLRTWVGDERDGLPTHDMIHTGARHWNAHGRRDGDVFQGSRLETALRWAATGRRHLTLSKLERDFLDACNAATRHRVRRRRLLTVALAVLLVLALAGGGLALRQSRLVSEQSRIVAAQRDEAVAGKVAAQADTMRATDPVRAMQLSVAAWRLAPISATRATLQNAWAQRERAVFTDPDTGAETVRQMTADGRTFVSVSPQGVRLYDVRTGKRIGGWNDLKMGADRFLGADLSPSGRLLAVAAGHAVTIWDTSTGRRTGARRKIDVPGFFGGLQFLTGDRYVNVVGSQGGDLWDIRTGATVSTRAGMLRPAVTPANDLVVNADLEGRFQLLSLPGGKPVARWHDGETCVKDGQVAAISPDGHTVACGTGSDISFVDLRTRRTLPQRMSTGGGRIWFSPDGRYLVADGNDRFELIRVSDGNTLLDYRVAPQNVAFDGTTLRYLADESVVSLDISDLLHPMRLPGHAPETAVFSPDGRFLATQQKAESRELVLWDVARRRPLGAPLKVTIGDSQMALAFSADGRLLASIGGLGQRLETRDTSQPTHVSAARLPDPWTASTVAVNENGTLVAVGASDTNDDLEGTGHSRVFVWDVPHHTWMRSVETGNLSGVVFRPGSPMMVPVTNSANRLIDLSTGQPVGPGFGPGGLNGALRTMAFSPDGAVLATGDESGRLVFWDVATGGKRGPTFRANPNDGVGITQIVFSPKGDVAASIGAGEVQLWDVATPRKLGPSMAAEGDSVSAAFGSDGAVLHTLDDKGVLRDMSVGPEATAATICARAGRGLTRADWQRYLPGVPYREVCP